MVCVCVCARTRVLSLSVVSDSFETPMTVAHKAPLSMRFPRQEYWSGDFPGGPVRWLRLCLSMQGTQMRSLVWEDPTCLRATKPARHSY